MAGLDPVVYTSIFRTVQLPGYVDVTSKQKTIFNEICKGKVTNPSQSKSGGYYTFNWGVKVMEASGSGFRAPLTGRKVPLGRSADWTTAQSTLSGLQQGFSFHKVMDSVATDDKGNLPAVWANYLTDHFDSLAREAAWKRDLALHLGTNMVLASIETVNSTTLLTLRNPYRENAGNKPYGTAQTLQAIPKPNVNIRVYSSDGANYRGTSWISVRDWANEQITLGSAINGMVQGDIIVAGDSEDGEFVAGASAGNGYNGFGTFNLTTPGYAGQMIANSGTIFNIDSSTYPVWQANILRTDAAAVIPYDYEHLFELVVASSSRGDVPMSATKVIMHPAMGWEHRRAYEAGLEYAAESNPWGYAKGQNMPSVTFEGQQIEILYDLLSPYDTIRCVCPEHIGFHVARSLDFDRGMSGGEPVLKDYLGQDEAWGYLREYGQVAPSALHGFSQTTRIDYDSNVVDRYHRSLG